VILVTLATFVLPSCAMADLWVSRSGTDSGFCSQANPCATLSRAVSLAISDATIYVGPGTFTDHVTVSPDTTRLTIAGSGMKSTVISGNFTGSVFRIDANTTATLQDMTIEQGQAAEGGGINNAGSLTLERDEVGLNAAITVSDDGASGAGGGIYSTGPLVIADSALVANQAARLGGALAAESNENSVQLSRDLVQGNKVVLSNGATGAVDVTKNGGGVSITQGEIDHSTLVDNQIVNAAGQSAGFGGGVFAFNVSLYSDTVADNRAAAGGGAGVAGQDTLNGTILAGNQGKNCSGFSTTASDSLEYGDAADTCGLAVPGHGNLIGVNPGLGPLAFNDGQTLSLAITSSSPAYDASRYCSGTDQRGVSELQRGATRCDMGAYQVSAPTTYVANPPANSVTAYASGATGDAPPVLRLGGPSTRLDQPTGVVADVQGDVFVTNAGANTLTEYAPEATGDASPVATITGGRTRLDQPQDVALDAVGDLWVTNSASVTKYAAGANGNVAPVARIGGTATRLSRPRGVVIDPDGNVRVTNGNGAILTFDRGASGPAAPRSQVTRGTGGNALISPQGLNFDATGGLIFADAGRGRIDTLAPGAAGPASPVSVLSPGSPPLQHPIGLDLDESGNVFVADSAANAVSEFAAGARGAASPVAVILGADTGLASPAFLSELPPPPAPAVRVATTRRRSRAQLLRSGIRLRIVAHGRLAFRGEPVRISATARVRSRLLATAKATVLRPGKLALTLIDTKRASRRLLRHHHLTITVLVTIRGGFGTRHRRVRLTSTG
jgi:hypothetical protein